MRWTRWGMVVGLLLTPLVGRAEPLRVFAAASLTDALRDISALWQQAGHERLRLSFGGSATLARQIGEGAPADLFASADARWMDDLARHGLIVPETRHDLLTNKLVLIMPTDPDLIQGVQIGPGFDLASLLGPAGRLAIGDPAYVPAGHYGEQALRKLGVWDSVAQHLARTDDARAALVLVQRREAPAGIVYATDAAACADVVVAGVFPEDSHDPIVYPFAITSRGESQEARALMDFLRSDAARAAFIRRGFTVK